MKTPLPVILLAGGIEDRRQRQLAAERHSLGPVREASDRSAVGFSLNLDSKRNSFCVQASGTVWLDPCEWRLPTLSVSISDAVHSPSLTMTLKKGVAVPIRIDDIGQLLSQHEGKTPGAHLLIGVTDGAGAFRTAATLSHDARGRNDQVVIPFDTSVRLVVVSSFFQLTDATGVPLLKTGATIPVNVPSGRQPSTIRLSVTGGGP